MPRRGGVLSGQGVTKAGAVVAVIFATSAALGFVREVVMAAYFGASAQTDAFLVAMIIPSFFLSMLGEASMGAAVVPVFIRYVMPQAPADRRRIVGTAFTLISLAFTAATVVAIVFAPAIAGTLAPGFDGDKLRLTAGLIRLVTPSLLVLGLSNFITGLLHSLRRFGPAAATGVVYNLGLVVVTVPLAQRYGITAAALGVLIGCFLQLAIMLPTLVREGLFPAVGLSFRDPSLGRMGRLFLPIFVGGLLVSALHAVDKVIGSYLPAGSISALNYASKIAGGPSRIFSMSLAVVLFPMFVKLATEQAADRGDPLVRGVNLAAFLTLPWTALVIALRSPIVFVILQRGAFDSAATSLVSGALVLYCLGDFADGISTMVNNAFYSHHDSKIPTLVYVGSNVFRVGAILALVPALGYLGIPAGSAITLDIEIVVLILLLRRHIKGLDLRALALGFGRIVAAAAVAGIVGSFTFGFYAAGVAGDQLFTTLALFASVVPAMAAYLIAARLLRCDEAMLVERRMSDLLGRMRRRAAELVG